MVKTNRTYQLQLELNQGNNLLSNVLNDFITITLPFTIEFRVDTKTLANSSYGHIKVYNLSKEHRDRIRQDLGQTSKRQLVLNAGYNNQLHTIAQGTIIQAWSVREGTNYITEIEFIPCINAINLATSNREYRAGTSYKTILKDLVSDLKPYQVNEGAIGSYDGTLKKGNAFSGSTSDLINELTGGGLFFYNDKAYVLNDNETVASSLPEISPATGLIGTPVRQILMVSLEMIFEPRLVPGQRVKLNSFTDESFNGEYKVFEIHHRGIISPVVCGEAVSNIVLCQPGVLSDV